jgi:hypothetical protein
MSPAGAGLVASVPDVVWAWAETTATKVSAAAALNAAFAVILM